MHARAGAIHGGIAGGPYEEGVPMRRMLVTAAMAAGALVAVGAAQAASWQVAAGEQSRPPAGTPKMTTLDAFFPSKLVINAGDSVTFSSASFHTVTYTGGKPPAALFVPDPSKSTYTGINDSTGAPFYFDGLPKFVYNGAAFAPIGGKTVTKGVPVSSGALSPAGPKAPPAKATYTFPKAGVFTLLCNVHPGMKVSVVVKPAGTPVPATPTQVTSKALSDINAAFAKAKVLAAKPVPANTVYAGIGGATTILSFYPQVLTVKAGTKVKFVNLAPSEVHNVAFGPKAYLLGFSKKTDFLPAGPTSKNQVTPVFPYGTDPKSAYTFDGTNHGNGFFQTQLLAGSSAIPLPRSVSVTFTKPGTYHYICFLHGPDMNGTIRVTP
jgi:plastocyanin